MGHLGAHQVFDAVADRESWNPGRLANDHTGRRSGWWGMSEGAESFLDELITWREIGFNMCAYRDDYDRYESLPDWARTTLEAHESDERPQLYSLEQLEAATTHDPIWNAAQRQLLSEGRIHGYLRMLWGKNILRWTPDARTALVTTGHGHRGPYSGRSDPCLRIRPVARCGCRRISPVSARNDAYRSEASVPGNLSSRG